MSPDLRRGVRSQEELQVQDLNAGREVAVPVGFNLRNANDWIKQEDVTNVNAAISDSILSLDSLSRYRLLSNLISNDNKGRDWTPHSFQT